MNNGTDQPTCGTCRHWCRQPANPSNLQDIKGECREAPPTNTSIPGPGGGVMKLTGYPVMGPNFVACSRHAPQKISVESR